MFERRVSPTDAGCSALEWLQRQIPQAPSAYLRQLLRKGRVLRHGAPLGEEERLTAGDLITLPESVRLQELLAAPAPVALTVLLETEQLLAVAKPSGLAIHRGLGHEHDNLTERVQALLHARGCRFQVAPVHRLDLETSGVVLFGKGHAAIARFGRLFMDGKVDKCYLGLAAGELSGSGWLDTTVPAKGKIKAARTHYQVLSQGAGLSLLDLRPETGRQHQLRRQLADAGHPLAGDNRYGGPHPAGLSRLFLHCRRLALTDPFKHAPLVVETPLPEELLNLLRRCRLTSEI